MVGYIQNFKVRHYSLLVLYSEEICNYRRAHEPIIVSSLHVNNVPSTSLQTVFRFEVLALWPHNSRHSRVDISKTEEGYKCMLKFHQTQPQITN